MGATDKQEYLLEFRQIGSSVKATAIDPETGEEVSVIAPANTAESELSALAIRKLRYVLAKKKGNDEPPTDASSTGRGGIVV
ncbi:MAG: serine hydroxymethyltransferase [Alphaproteobacteria bacterium]|nr:serine hydroxymethyltransferase [Alphaproteobacteria bacterium]